MPFRSPGWAGGAHELGKLIFPRPSEDGAAAAPIWALQEESAAKIDKISKNLTGNIGNPTCYFQ